MFSPSRFFSTDPLYGEQAFSWVCVVPPGVCMPESIMQCARQPAHKANTTHQASCALRLDGAGWQVFVKLFYVDECKISVHFKD